MLKQVFFLVQICFYFFSHTCMIPVYAQEQNRIFPPPKQIEIKSSYVAFTDRWKIKIDMQNEEKIKCARFLKRKLNEKFSLNLITEPDENSKAQKSIRLLTTDEKLAVKIMEDKKIKIDEIKTKEGYFLDIMDEQIIIIANKPKGIFYGILSLLQLTQVKDNMIFMQKATVIDYPNLPVRGVYFLELDFQNIYKQLDLMAQFKFNTAVIFNWGLFNLEETENRKKIKAVFDYARGLFIEPIPELGCFGSAGPLLKNAPGSAEGIWVEDERFKFIDNTAVAAISGQKGIKNLIKNDECEIIVYSLDKNKTYRENIDYEILEGLTVYPFSVENKAFEIIRLPSGSIKADEDVLISYDYVENKCAGWAPWSFAYCPSSDISYEVMSKTIGQVIALLGPEIIFLGTSEVRGINRDSRCRKRKLSNAQLFADDINKNYSCIKQIDPKIKIIMWDDMLNPWHNGGNENYQFEFGGVPGKTDKAIDLIPRDITIAIWWYDEDDRLGKMKYSPDYFSEYGFNFLCSPWKNKKNIKDWVKIARDKNSCLGVLVTSWDGWDNNLEGIKYSAEFSW